MQRSKLLQKLRSLADHPATLEHERASARARIAELEAPKPGQQPIPPVVREAGGAERLRGIRARPQRAPAFHEQWPFGWTGPRVPVEYEVDMTADGGLAVGWKCPCCGSQVERSILPRIIRQCARPARPGERPPMEEFMRRMTGGSQNQLCRACWDRWEAA